MHQNDNKLNLKASSLGRELDSHITIKYGLLSDEVEPIKKLFKNQKPFKATLGEIKHFEPKGMPFDVLCVEVFSKDLSDMNEKITKELKCATGLPSDEYHPHITIAYIKKGTCKDLYGNKEFVGKEITIDSVEFSPVEGDKFTIELGNKKEAKICYTYKIGDKVRDRSNGKVGIIKEINGKEVILEEVL
jgi:2'-5' RNA ligase